MTRNIKEFVNQNGLGASVEFPTRMGEDHVCILLGLYNGAANLKPQLLSLAKQSHKDWSLIISDDGSLDDWFGTVSGFADRHAPGRTWLMQGPQTGFAQNFLSLVRRAGPIVPYAAFCDQDDIWLRYKLARALAHLKAVPEGLPGLYAARTMICDADLTPLRRSPLFKRRPSFENALVQSIGGGNTMVINRAALDLLQDTAPRASGVVAHDWWAYQLVSGAGGVVLYDRTPSVLYRQHPDNAVGASDTLLAGLQRMHHVAKGRFRTWNDANIDALDRSRPWLTPDAANTLDHFKAARAGRLHRRLQALWRSGATRQRLRGTLALFAAAAINRL